MFGGGMYVAASAVLISSEVLNNSAAYGGGLAGGSYLLQEGSLVSSNKASKQGGGIWSDNYLEVTNCSMLSQNSAGEEGGGVFLDSGSALTLSSDSAVEDNEGGSGGGIQCGTHATITMDAASVVRNRAASNGGGIVASEGCTLTLDNGSMVWNNAALKGGGIFANKASAVDVLSNSSVSYNVAGAGEGGGMYARDVASIMFSDMQLLGNQAALNGGGLHLSHSMANIMHSEVSWNMAVTGGGIHSATDVQMTINGSRVGGNVAKSGGGIDSTDSGAELLLYGSLIAANEAQGGNGGGISIAGPLEAEDSEISGSIAYIDGGGIYAEALVVLRGCHILWNVAHSNGAGIRSNTDTFLEDSRVCENVCWGLGGGVYHRTNKLQVHAASQVCRNTAEYGGGVYAWTAASILLEEGSLVEENKAKQTGGGMWLSAGCELEVRSSSGVVNNSAEKEGGGVAMQEGDATMRVTNQSRLEGNRAELYSGGGISTALGNRVWLESSELSFNFAGTYGGGMLLYQAVAEAVSMRIIGNAATYAGGGMQIMKGSQIWFWGTLMQPVVIANNTAVEQGGGVGVFSVSEAWFGFTDDTSSGSVWAPSTNLSACAGSVLGQLDLTKDHAVVLSHNEAETGAVLYGEDSSVITLQDGHIYGNTAHRDEASDAPDVTVGGILNVQASTFNMLDSVLEGNSGSGCLIGQNALVAIQGSVFMNHTSVSHGGGIRTMRGSDTSLTDSAFVANSVQGQGSAVHAHGALEVSQCSFEGGRAEHGGALAGKLYENQRMALTLCALCRNVAAENGAALYLTLAASLNGSALLQLTDLELRGVLNAVDRPKSIPLDFDPIPGSKSSWVTWTSIMCL
eukprot:gene6590-7890_t